MVKTKEKPFDFRGVKPPRRKPAVVRNESRDEDGLIDWRTFWSSEHVEEDWLISPVVPRGREVSVFCPAGGGKSELALFIVAGTATGRAVLDRPEGEPIETVYLDYEMTEGDLYGRLLDLGYGPDDDLSHLHYYLLPNLPPLDTPDGGERLLEIVKEHRAELVVIDTTGRVIQGGENDSDSLRDFHQHTGSKLKAVGVSVMRLDHAGKDTSRGQRGTSAKADDVDVIWELSKTKAGAHLSSKLKRRQSWVPEDVYLVRRLNPLRYDTSKRELPEGTTDAMKMLDDLKVQLDITVRSARQVLKDHGKRIDTTILAAAIRERRKSQHTRKPSRTLGKKKSRT